MQENDLIRRDGAQMLLATGVVLLMSLLSMAIFGVKVAGLTIPHDAASDDVIVTAEEVMESIESLSQARTDMWITGGLEGSDAAELAIGTVHDDLLHHGELRGVEVKLTNISITENTPNQLSITAQLGVSDGGAMLSIDVAFTLDV